jgi:hypothetical protein
LSPQADQRSGTQGPATREDVELLAYRIWLGRRDRNISGDANCDYYQAERILASRKNQRRLLLGSFGFSTVAFVLGHSQEEHFANATNALIGLTELDLGSVSASASVSGDGSDDAG